MRQAALWSWLLLSACAVPGCVDVRSFAGSWSGGIVSEEGVRQGFTTDTRVQALTLSQVELQTIIGSLTTTDGKFHDTRLEPVLKFANDALAGLTFDGAPLRSYLRIAPLASEPGGHPAYMVISLFGDDHVELRVFRGKDDLFGVFMLHREDP